MALLFSNSKPQAIYLFVLFFLSSGLILFSTGCCCTALKGIPNGKLETEGCIIEAFDGSFKFKGGEEFTPPYQNAQYIDAFFSDKYIFDGIDIVNGSDIALKAGAHSVRIYTPYSKAKLYGVLFLGKAFDNDSVGPAGRSYLIKLPEEYVKKAMNGRISVVYELQKIKGNIFCNTFCKTEMPTWILWMSDQRFW